MTDSLDLAVTDIAEAHHGNFSASHLRDLRVSDAERKYRLSSGRWTAPHRARVPDRRGSTIMAGRSARGVLGRGHSRRRVASLRGRNLEPDRRSREPGRDHVPTLAPRAARRPDRAREQSAEHARRHRRRQHPRHHCRTHPLRHARRVQPPHRRLRDRQRTPEGADHPRRAGRDAASCRPPRAQGHHTAPGAAGGARRAVHAHRERAREHDDRQRSGLMAWQSPCGNSSSATSTASSSGTWISRTRSS